LGSLDYFDISKEETLDLTLNSNKGIVEVVMEEDVETNYGKASHMMESNSISLGDLQGEEFTVDNENKDIKGDWVLPIIQKDMIYKKFIFRLKD